MYNLLKGKEESFWCLMIGENSMLGKQRNVFTKKAVFVLTNAQHQFVWVLCWIGSKPGSTIIPADATSVTDLENLVDQAVAILGGK
jgi:enoyl-[acyl-carrier protein] reductase I